MADFTSIPTVELLTRAADAAGRAVAECEAEAPENAEMLGVREMHRTLRGVGCQPGSARMLAASGPDHWRAVEATFRAALERHKPVRSGGYTICGTCDMSADRSAAVHIAASFALSITALGLLWRAQRKVGT